MCGVCGSGLSYPETNLEIILINYSTEAISAYWIVTTKLDFVHIPKLWPANPWI